MRYTDTELDMHRKDDFVGRTRIPTLAQLIIVIIVGYLLILGAFHISNNFAHFAIITLLLVSLMNGMMVFSVQRARDQMMVTEFQNALYSSALSLNNQFCIIVRKDGVVVHADSGFRTMYPQFERSLHRTIDDVLQIANVNRQDTDAIFKLLGNGTAGQHMISMRDSDGMSHRMMLYVDPIRRPPNYLLLRGRTYVEPRAT